MSLYDAPVTSLRVTPADLHEHDLRRAHPMRRTATPAFRWNFEKWLVAPGATSIPASHPQVKPEDPVLVEAIEAVLPARV